MKWRGSKVMHVYGNACLTSDEKKVVWKFLILGEKCLAKSSESLSYFASILVLLHSPV